MKSRLLLSLPLFLAMAGFSQSGTDIRIGKKDSVYSSVLKENRKLLVYTPDMSGDPGNAAKRYPVLYLLDGDAHFQSVVGMVQQLSQANGNAVIPEMIVVAIPNTDRTRDLTPTHIQSDLPMMDSNFSRNTGGGENFAAFLEKELIPYIDTHYATTPYRLLIGHSFGGLTVMNILTNHRQLFRSYIAIDPSMWYDKERFLTATQKNLKSGRYDGIHLYLGIANTMPEGMSLEAMKKDTNTVTRHIRSIFSLDKFIKADAKNGLRFASGYYPDDDHGSVPFITEYDGLRFIFTSYRLQLSPDDFLDTGTGIVEKLKKHYKKISEEMGYKISAPEMWVNGMGYNALFQKQYGKAAALFELNIANYPESGNTYDSYADLLLARGDTAAAIYNFKKAFSMTNSEDTRSTLDILTGKTGLSLTTKDLEKYIGVFEFESIPVIATTYLKDGVLWVSAPGQGDYELMPSAPDMFIVKGVQGYTVKFEMKDAKATGLTATQPNGTFPAKRKKE